MPPFEIPFEIASEPALYAVAVGVAFIVALFESFLAGFRPDLRDAGWFEPMLTLVTAILVFVVMVPEGWVLDAPVQARIAAAFGVTIFIAAGGLANHRLGILSLPPGGPKHGEPDESSGG